MSNDDPSNDLNRRDFLKAAASVAAAGTLTNALEGCSQSDPNQPSPIHVTDEQRAWRKKGRSQVGIIACDSYEEDIFETIRPQLVSLHLPDFKNKTVVLKPNMVEYREGKPVTTNPAVLIAAIKLAWHLGAKAVTVAEGPGHMRDTEYLLDVTGLGKACKVMDVPFVDLNIDDLVELDNQHGFTKLEKFYLPKTIALADAVVSVPKLKTHHWVGITCSMKNLFGTVPGRKYGWPKNLLHVRGIPNSIIDLQHLVKPALGFVDAIVTMEGDGPINGEAKKLGYIVLGQDLAAIDATCARMMKLKPTDYKYLRMAGEVVGNIEETDIDVVGPIIGTIAQSYEMPITFGKNKDLLKEAGSQGS
ncbi:MAG: DUF362 domain-containing protein [Candidatus Melainabacteria bacterium]|nr:DUF362 domain-containing protein [Candidatus Melainabacteria bacterium]